MPSRPGRLKHPTHPVTASSLTNGIAEINYESAFEAFMKGAPMNGYGKRALIVEHDEAERDVLSLMLENERYNVHMASDERRALEEMKRRRFDVVVIAHDMPHVNGFRLVLIGRLVWPDTPMILLSKDDASLSEMVEQGGAYGSLRKPYEFCELLELMRNAIQLARGYRSRASNSFRRSAR
jgi:DNA-binding NtrC family response regulator